MKTISLETAKELQRVAEEKKVKLPFADYEWGKRRIYTKKSPLGKRENKLSEFGVHKCMSASSIGVVYETAWAYTTDELLEFINSVEIVNTTSIRVGGYRNYIATFQKQAEYIETKADTPADALGLLAVELIKRGIIK